VSPAEYKRATRLLIRNDPVLAAIIRRHGPCGLAAAQRADHFTALVRAITFQQLSGKAASTIYARMVASLPDGNLTPEALQALSDDQLRAAGISRQKGAYLRDLSNQVIRGTLDLGALDQLPDEQVIAELVKVKGIGRWSAEMFLIFRLHRPDVLPLGDVGIINAIRKAYRLRKNPTSARILRMGEAWRPYRSVASWYLWRSLDNAPVVARNGAGRGSRPATRLKPAQ
jgi:DNA-3-methyladenine glycosylase II